MTLQSSIRKIYLGVADRRQMYRMFDRHAGRPNRWQGDDSALFAGEWFELGRVEHDHMLDFLPPLWIRGEMFALGEFLLDVLRANEISLAQAKALAISDDQCRLNSPRRQQKQVGAGRAGGRGGRTGYECVVVVANYDLLESRQRRKQDDGIRADARRHRRDRRPHQRDFDI